MSYYTEGTLVIDLVDAEKKEMVWRGMGTGIVKRYKNPEDAQRNIDKIVDRIMQGFPPK